MRTLEERVARLERLLSRNLFTGVEPTKKKISEAEAIAKYGVKKGRLRQLRLGHMGRPPVLKKWTTTRGRRPEYDVAELESYFKKVKPIF